jgi:hypothetical protein
VSAAALLAELAAAGVWLRRDGEDLVAETRRGFSLEPYRERIATNKPALLIAIDARETAAACGLDPALDWRFVYRGPVEACQPLAGWTGIAPAGCGAPIACRVLGPCRHLSEHGRCWKDAAA